MEQVRISEFGGPEVLVRVQLPDPEARSGEVLVRVEAAGVGRADVLMRMGLYPGRSEAGFAPGVDIVGTVIGLGAGVEDAWLNKRVLAVLDDGGYSTRAVVPIDRCIRVPPQVTPVSAAALGVNAITAVEAVSRVGPLKDKSVAVTGVSGGLGSCLLRWAERTTDAVGISTSPERATRLHPDSTIVTQGGLGPASFDIVFDVVGGSSFVACIDALRPNGIVVMCGFAAGLPPAATFDRLVQRFTDSLHLQMFSLRSVSTDDRQAAGQRVVEAAVEGFTVPIDSVVDMDGIADAHDRIENNLTKGKVVLCP